MTSITAFAVVLVAAVLAPLTAMATTEDSGDTPRPSRETLTSCDGHNHQHTFKHHKRWSKGLWRSYSIPRWAKEKHRHSVKCASGPAQKKAMKKRWKRIKRSVLPENHDLWVAIGRCEQPGSGYKGVNWQHTGPTYQGGLGFWYGTWASFKYPGMPSNAGYATWRQQMKVANRLYRMYGTSPWGCA